MLMRLEVQKRGHEIRARFIVLDGGMKQVGEHFSDIWEGVTEIKRIGTGLKMLFPIRHDEIELVMAKAGMELLRMQIPSTSGTAIIMGAGKPDSDTLMFARCLCELAPFFQAILPKDR